MRYLNAIDYSVIGVYCAGLLTMGLLLRRKATQNLEAYFLAGRSLHWFILGISGMASSLDMAGTMVIVSFLYMLGPRGLYIEFRGGAVLVLVFMLLFTGKWHYRSRCMTGAEWQIYRFGTGLGGQLARIIAAVAGIAVMTGMIVYLMKGAGLFLAMFMPFPPMTCVAVMVALTTLYTVLSGFYGTVYTNLIQAGLTLVIVVVVSGMAIVRIAGYPGDLGTLASEVTGARNWLSSMPVWHTPMPKGYEDYGFVALLACTYLLRNVLCGLGSGADPRYFGARSERECGLLTFFWTWLMGIRWPIMMAFAVLGVFLVKEVYTSQSQISEASAVIKQHLGDTPKDHWEGRLAEITRSPEKYPDLGVQLQRILAGKQPGDWAAKLQLVSYEGTVNPERILPAVILMRVPAGLRGLFVAFLVAAAMSVLSPQMNSATALFTRDLYQGFLRPRAGNRELIGVSYVFGVVLVVASFGLTYKTSSINDIWDWINMALTAGLLAPGLLRLYWWRFNGAGVFWGTLVGLITAVIQRHWFGDWSPDMKFTVCTLAGLLGSVVGTYTAPPTERAVLEHFYRTTRPFGLWAPFKATLPPDVRAAMSREHLHDMLSVPFALVWQVSLFLLPMQALIGSWGAFKVTFLIFLISLGGLLWFWYRHLPSVEVGKYPASVLMGAEQDKISPALAGVSVPAGSSGATAPTETT